jgi:hypothetical protein
MPALETALLETVESREMGGSKRRGVHALGHRRCSMLETDVAGLHGPVHEGCGAGRGGRGMYFCHRADIGNRAITGPLK